MNVSLVAFTLLGLASYAMWAAIRIENLKLDLRDASIELEKLRAKENLRGSS